MNSDAQVGGEERGVDVPDRPIPDTPEPESAPASENIIPMDPAIEPANMIPEMMLPSGADPLTVFEFEDGFMPLETFPYTVHDEETEMDFTFQPKKFGDTQWFIKSRPEETADLGWWVMDNLGHILDTFDVDKIDDEPWVEVVSGTEGLNPFGNNLDHLWPSTVFFLGKVAAHVIDWCMISPSQRRRKIEKLREYAKSVLAGEDAETLQAEQAAEEKNRVPR